VPVKVCSARKEPKPPKVGGQGCDVILKFITDLQHRDHVVVTNNYFTSPVLHDKLLKEVIWATGTCKTIGIGMPKRLHEIAVGLKGERGLLYATMHRSR